MSQSPIEKISEKQFAVSWDQVYRKIGEFLWIFNDSKMCDTTIKIECRSCRTQFSFIQLMKVGALSSLPRFIGLADNVGQFDPGLLRLSQIDSDNWTCPRCSSDKVVFTWIGSDQNDLSLFSSAFSMEPKKPWDAKLEELTSFLSNAQDTTLALDILKSFRTDELERASPVIRHAVMTNPSWLFTFLLGEQSTERLRKFLLTLPEVEHVIGSNPVVLGKFLGEHSTEQLRRFACRAVSKMAAEETLLSVLQSGDALARACAADVLSEIGTVSSIELLKLASQSDPDPYVQDMATRALSRISSR